MSISVKNSAGNSIVGSQNNSSRLTKHVAATAAASAVAAAAAAVLGLQQGARHSNCISSSI